MAGLLDTALRWSDKPCAHRDIRVGDGVKVQVSGSERNLLCLLKKVVAFHDSVSSNHD
jgi:hypothetical protein